MKTAAAISMAILLAGCSTVSNLREHEVSANLPRAQGLGAWTPACLFFCFVESHYVHGDDTIDPNATEALMHSKLQVEQFKKNGAQPPPMIQKRVKPKPPPQGAKP